MDMTQGEETILKTDVLGRVKTPATRREELLDEFAAAGSAARSSPNWSESNTRLLRPGRRNGGVSVGPIRR